MMNLKEKKTKELFSLSCILFYVFMFHIYICMQVLSRDYAVGAMVNEDELNAEFAALDGELDAIPDDIGTGAFPATANSNSNSNSNTLVPSSSSYVPANTANGNNNNSTSMDAQLAELMGGGGGGGGGGGAPWLMPVPPSGASAHGQRIPSAVAASSSSVPGSAGMYGR